MRRGEARRRGEPLRRGQVLTIGPGVEASSTWLVALRPPAFLVGDRARPRSWPPRPGTVARLHLGTQQADATIRSPGSGPQPKEPGPLVATLRLSEAVAGLAHEHAVLRDPGTSGVVGGVTLLEPLGLRGPSRRRATPERLEALLEATDAEHFERALLDLHGALSAARRDSIGAAFDAAPDAQHGLRLAQDVETELRALALERIHDSPDGVSRTDLRSELLGRLRRLATIDRPAQADGSDAIDRLIGGLVADGNVARQADRLLEPSRRAAVEGDLEVAMTRLEAALDVDVPPSLGEAMAAAACPPEGLRALESSGRIVRVEDDLAWSRARYQALRDRAASMAAVAPLTPAAFRDAIGGNRRVVMPLLEDFGRKGVLRRTDAGHVPGPRATVRA